MDSTNEGAFFGPETLQVLRSVLDEVWERLQPSERAGTSRAALAERILKAAADVERDPIRLRAMLSEPEQSAS